VHSLIEQLRPLATLPNVVLGFLVGLSALTTQLIAHYRHKNTSAKREEDKLEITAAAQKAAREVKDELAEAAKLAAQKLVNTDEKISEIQVQVNGRMTQLLKALGKAQADNMRLAIENKVLKEKLVESVILKKVLHRK
jgi:hypothetical protein